MMASTRLHYMDGIRALAMLAGVVLHCFYTFGETYRHLVPGGGPDGNDAIDLLTIFIHSFRMPLFFLVSGFFAYLLIQKRGLIGYLKNRSLRILLPFLIFLPMISALIIAALFYHINQVDYQSLFTKLIVQVNEAKQAGIQHPYDTGPRTAHLWFLYYLIFFSICTFILARFSNVFINHFMSRLFKSQIGLWLILPLFTVPGFYLAIGITGYLPAPDLVIPVFWPFALYGVYFLLGWFLYQNVEAIELMGKGVWWRLALGIALYLVLLGVLPTINIDEMKTGDLSSLTPGLTKSIIIAVVEAYLAFYLVVVCLYLGKKWLSHPSSKMRYISDASYWVYIIHLPIAIFTQILLIDMELSIWLKITIVLLATTFLSFSSYHLLVRNTPIGWMLNGKKKKSEQVILQPSS